MKPIYRGLRSQYIPDPAAEIGHCVHHIAMNPKRPGVLFMQKHWDVMRSDDGGDNWKEVSGNLPTDFGFVIDIHAHEPETIYVVPIKSDSEHYVHDAKLRVFRSKTGGNEWEALTKGLPQSDCYVNVLRDAMAVDSLDKCGVYFGTTGGQVYASADAGDSWNPIVRDLPAVLSVEVQMKRHSRWPLRSPWARCWMRWRLGIRCCVARSAIMSRNSGVRSCASSLVSRTCPTIRQTRHFRTLSFPGKSR